MASCFKRLPENPTPPKFALPHHPPPEACHFDRRDGAVCRPEAEKRFYIARFLCDEIPLRLLTLDLYQMAHCRTSDSCGKLCTTMRILKQHVYSTCG